MAEKIDAPDARYTATSEFCGYSVPMLVVRFCGERIGVSNNLPAALRIMNDHNDKRQLVLEGNHG
jgi:hypothetical protein